MQKQYKTQFLASLLSTLSLASVAAEAIPSAPEHILAGGRWLNNGGYQATWPGVSLAARFKGEAVGIVLKDERSHYAVEIDGRIVQQIAPAFGKRTIWIRNLAAGEHQIELIRRNETPDYIGTVYGFTLENGQWLTAPTAPKRKIEFIGDSFTASLSNLSNKRECNENEIAGNTDISQGFAIKVARQLGAQWQTNAMSGMGMIRNWNGNLPDRDFRTFYPRQLQTDANSKLDASWQPQVVVIGLGINDFSTQVNAGEKRTTEQRATDFQAAYRQLIAQLNERYNNPQIIVTALKLWPDDQQRPNVEAVVKQEKAAGNTRIHYLNLDPMQLTSCHWHPNLSDHQQIAQQLKEKIAGLTLDW